MKVWIKLEKPSYSAFKIVCQLYISQVSKRRFFSFVLNYIAEEICFTKELIYVYIAKIFFTFLVNAFLVCNR